MRYKICFLFLGLALFQPVVQADSVAMRDYTLLTNGMSEADVLYRLGPYDHETVNYDYFSNILHKTWYYIPAPDEVSNRHWITEVRFNRRGIVVHLDRYKAR